MLFYCVCLFVYEFTHLSINLLTHSPSLILRVLGDIVLSIFLPGLSWSVCMRTHQSTYISFSSTLSVKSVSDDKLQGDDNHHISRENKQVIIYSRISHLYELMGTNLLS